MQIIKHHKKYKEIHGIDEVVLMPRSEHDKLHRRLRREEKCNISVDELEKISNRAYNKAYIKEYRENHREEYNRYMRDYRRKQSRSNIG